MFSSVSFWLESPASIRLSFSPNSNSMTQARLLRAAAVMGSADMVEQKLARFQMGSSIYLETVPESAMFQILGWRVSRRLIP